MSGTVNGQPAAIKPEEERSEMWYGKLAVQTATAFGSPLGIVVYRAISGASVFGADTNDEAKVIGSGDTSAANGSTFRLSRILMSVSSVSVATVLRIVWGTGTMAEGIAAGNVSSTMFRQASTVGDRVPYRIQMPKVPVGTQVWIQSKCATDNATVDFYVGVTFYER